MTLSIFQARKIALAGQQFARNHLMGDSILCYYYKLFKVPSSAVAELYQFS